MKSIRSIFRRVQGTNKNDQAGDDLSRSSSITNLSDTKNKGASSKIKKSASKDRLDKIVDKKNDKKGLTKNNNKIEDIPTYSTESLQEIESLQRQLQEMANEKSNLALQLGEQKGQCHALEKEMLNLNKLHEQLNQENNLLRNRLKDVAHSPLSDNEKQQLLLESHRHHSSAPASIATNLIEDASAGDVTACPTPDWDKHSSSNASEISVACLQDRINQMEETHYSTKEELQATVQELNDLQRQLTELQQDNYQLLEEKNLMFDSLCRQTERLNESKNEIETLKQRLREKEDDSGQYESAIEHEQKLLALLKDAQAEREILLMKQEQLTNELQEALNQNTQQVTLIEQLNERVKTLESTLDAKHAEHKQLEQEVVVLKDQSSGMQIEIDRLSDQLENARTKIVELEQDRALSDKSELDELLDNARKEKDALESEVTNLKEQVARSKNESEKLKDQVSILQEECKVTRNNAKCTQSELEYKCEMLTADKNTLNEQLIQLQEAANGLQMQAQCQLEDKRQLSTVLSETQKLLSEAERRNQELESELEDLKKLRKEENEEWEKFQNDLLTSVRVANDFKTEAQQDLQKMILENKAHREKVRHLEAQIDKLRVSSTENITLRPTGTFSIDQIEGRRPKVSLNRQNSRQSVKSLIESIENASKPVIKTGLGSISRSSSNSSLNSLTSSELRTPSSPPIMPPSPMAPISPVKSPDWDDPLNTTLREQQGNKQNKEWNKSIILGDNIKSTLNKTEDILRDPPVFQSKTIDYSRRNSYSDLSERKDPLNSLVKNGG
ncbi:hypothetical protein AMK59_6292, partial [Oryctes borbonicus]